MTDTEEGASLNQETLGGFARETGEESLDCGEATIDCGMVRHGRREEKRRGEHGRASGERREEKGEKLLKHLLGLSSDRGGELARGEALLKLASEESGLSPRGEREARP